MKTLAFNTSNSQKLLHALVNNATEQQLAPRYGQDPSATDGSQHCPHGLRRQNKKSSPVVTPPQLLHRNVSNLLLETPTRQCWASSHQTQDPTRQCIIKYLKILHIASICPTRGNAEYGAIIATSKSISMRPSSIAQRNTPINCRYREIPSPLSS